jgi:hypothetical protein
VQLDLHGNSIASTLPPQWGSWLPQVGDTVHLSLTRAADDEFMLPMRGGNHHSLDGMHLWHLCFLLVANCSCIGLGICATGSCTCSGMFAAAAAAAAAAALQLTDLDLADNQLVSKQYSHYVTCLRLVNAACRAVGRSPHQQSSSPSHSTQHGVSPSTVDVMPLTSCCCMQTGYLPWSWGDLQSISQIDLSNNRLSG